jgi:methylmalonyl-CoA/ethylmalonyl-CoA epimerase
VPTPLPVPPAAALGRVAQISVNVKELPRAIAFWRDTLGLKLLFEAPPKMAFFDCGGTRLMLSLPERAEFDHPSSILYFQVEDLPAAHARLATAGVRFRQPPTLVACMPDHELWMAFFEDSEGNSLALTSEVRGARRA